MKKLTWAIVGGLCCMLFVAGCGSDSGPAPVPTSNVELRIAFDLSTGVGNEDVAMSSRPWDAGGIDSLVLNGGALVARSFHFDASPKLNGGTNVTAADENRDLGNTAIKFQGPYVVEVDGSAVLLGQAEIPVGDYHHMSFVLRQGRDSDNLKGHSELVGYSAVVTGTSWYGNRPVPFRFVTDLETKFDILGEFTVDDNNSDFALVFDIGSWFGRGNQWLDPNDPANYAQITKNIKNSVRGGFDMNADGYVPR